MQKIQSSNGYFLYSMLPVTKSSRLSMNNVSAHKHI